MKTGTMCVLRLLVLGFMISASHESDSGGLFSHDHDAPYPPFYDDLEADASDTEADYDSSSDVSSATVTYDKNAYLGDMMKHYFGVNEKPPPPVRPPPEPTTETTIITQKPVPLPSGMQETEKTHSSSGGFGKIDISIQYGCCGSATASQGQREKQTVEVPGIGIVPTTEPPRKVQDIITVPPIESTARFHQPPGVNDYPNSGYDDTIGGYPPPFYSSQGEYPSPGYMGYNIKNNEESKYGSKHETKQDFKRYYQQNKNEKPKLQTESPVENYYTPNYIQDTQKNKNQQYMTPATSTTTERSYTMSNNINNNNNKRYDNYRNYETTTDNLINYQYDTTTDNANNYRYRTTPNNYRYDTTTDNYRYKTTTPANNLMNYRYGTTTNSHNSYRYGTTTTPKPTTRMSERTTIKPSYNQQPNSPVVVAQEQFYTIQNPPFYGPGLSPISPVSTLTRGLPIPAERSALYTSERLLPSNFMYGSYLQPPMSYYQISSMDKNIATGNRQQQNSPASGTPNSMYYVNHVTPRSILQDISKIVIKDVPKRDLYSIEQQPVNNYPSSNSISTPAPRATKSQHYQPRQPRDQQYQPYQQSKPSSTEQPPTSSTTMTSSTEWEPPSSTYLPTSPPNNQDPNETNEDNENLIAKNRETFMTLQKQAYDLFTKAALKDFQTLLSNDINKKEIEVLPEERQMLDLQTDPKDEISLRILDYLTVYERYSEVLNNTELANHLLQDMDRAKEYLGMKLNKFWLELDVMETPADFLEKKAYYKSREKPSGIMNIFYDWYEKTICNPSEINIKNIENKLVEIMKKERRYWLLLLRS